MAKTEPQTSHKHVENWSKKTNRQKTDREREREREIERERERERERDEQFMQT